MDQLIIRRMEEGDIAQAVQIEQACFSDPWSYQVYQATLLLPFAHYYVAQVPVADKKEPVTLDEVAERVPEDMLMRPQGKDPACRIVGMIGLEIIAPDGEISNVAVMPQYRRQGIAHALMRQALADGTKNGCRNFTLEVREGNTAARALYESFGFAVEGCRRNYYDKPVENALIMWKRG